MKHDILDKCCAPRGLTFPLRTSTVRNLLRFPSMRFLQPRAGMAWSSSKSGDTFIQFTWSALKIPDSSLISLSLSSQVHRFKIFAYFFQLNLFEALTVNLDPFSQIREVFFIVLPLLSYQVFCFVFFRLSFFNPNSSIFGRKREIGVNHKPSRWENLSCNLQSFPDQSELPFHEINGYSGPRNLNVFSCSISLP